MYCAIFRVKHKQRQSRISIIKKEHTTTTSYNTLGENHLIQRLRMRGNKVCKNRSVIVNTPCSWIAVFEQAATRYPTCVHFCCFDPVTHTLYSSTINGVYVFAF